MADGLSQIPNADILRAATAQPPNANAAAQPSPAAAQPNPAAAAPQGGGSGAEAALAQATAEGNKFGQVTSNLIQGSDLAHHSDDDILRAASAPAGEAKDAAPESKEPESFLDHGKDVATGLINQLLGGYQRTTPVTHDIQGNPQYQLAGKLINSDAGPLIDEGNGKWVPIDPTKHVVLLDEKTGQPQVYNRSDNTDTSLATAAGHILGFGAISPSGIKPPMGMASDAQNALSDFEKSGVRPNLPAVTGNPTLGAIAKGMSNIPLAGSPIVKGTAQSISDIAQRASDIAAGFGKAGNPEEGGEALQEGASAFRGEPGETPTLSEAKSTPTRDIGFTNKASALYDAIPIAADRPAQVSNTIDELTALKTKFESNPDLGAALQNPKFGQYAEALEKGGLSWGDLQDFRSFVGRQMRQPSGELGLGPDDWRGLYGAVSSDMEATAKTAGLSAENAFNRANNYYSAGLDRINTALAVVNDANSPEKAYYGLTKMASARGAGADVNTLQRVMRSMPQEQRDDFVSSVVNRLGLPTKSAAGANPDNFSVGTFVSNYADLADKAKEVLFGPAGTEQREALDSLARVANSVKNVERLGNPSGTARQIEWGAIGAGLVAQPLATAAVLASNYLGAGALMSPRLTRWLVGMQGVQSKPAMALQVARLKVLTDAQPGLVPFYKALVTAQQSQPGGSPGESPP